MQIISSCHLLPISIEDVLVHSAVNAIAAKTLRGNNFFLQNYVLYNIMCFETEVSLKYIYLPKR